MVKDIIMKTKYFFLPIILLLSSCQSLDITIDKVSISNTIPINIDLFSDSKKEIDIISQKIEEYNTVSILSQDKIGNITLTVYSNKKVIQKNTFSSNYVNIKTPINSECIIVSKIENVVIKGSYYKAKTMSIIHIYNTNSNIKLNAI
jgi:hypothetical protein